MSAPFLIARIERLEARIERVEARLDALEGANVSEPSNESDRPADGQDGGETPKPKRKTTGK